MSAISFNKLLLALVLLDYSFTNRRRGAWEKMWVDLLRIFTVEHMVLLCEYYFIFNNSPIAHNVKVVYDVFAVAIKEMRSISSTKKMWWSKIPQRRLRRLVFCGTQTAD
jgi:hypothetical protein